MPAASRQRDTSLAMARRQRAGASKPTRSKANARDRTCAPALCGRERTRAAMCTRTLPRTAQSYACMHGRSCAVGWRTRADTRESVVAFAPGGSSHVGWNRSRAASERIAQLRPSIGVPTCGRRDQFGPRSVTTPLRTLARGSSRVGQFTAERAFARPAPRVVAHVAQPLQTDGGGLGSAHVEAAQLTRSQ